MQVRVARPEDASACCAVLRRSIIELCSADHGGDPAILAAWLANKTPQAVASWLADGSRHLVVAAAPDGTILGVGMACAGGDDAGTVELNYVSPDARFRGVSRAILQELEDWLRGRGCDRCRLVSTATARRFYAGSGYRPDGPAVRTLGVTASQPMIRAL